MIVSESNMEKAAVEDGSGATRSKLLRYALRSGIKSKEEKPEPLPAANPSAPRSAKGKSTAMVSKSMGVLDLSAKAKYAMPPSRRISIPAKSSTNSASRLAGSVTPVSEARSRRSARSDVPPIGDLTRSSTRQKALLSSTMYWLSQIQISEASAKHPVSLGFFKLAVEAGCKPVEKMQSELKSYVKRHDLARSGGELKLEELFECYNISESLEQLQIEEPSSDVMDEAMRSSVDEDAQSSSSVASARKLKPKSLNSVVGSAKENVSKKLASRVKGSVQDNQAQARPGGVTDARKLQNRCTKSVKLEMVKGKDNPGRREEANIDEGQEQILVAGNVTEDKENLEASAV